MDISLVKDVHRASGLAGIVPAAVMIGLLFVVGCVSDGPIAPLVPLPDSQMPSKEDLVFRPWRVVVADVWGQHRSLEEAFSAELKSQLARYGIQNVNSDERVDSVMRNILATQLRGGGDVTARDMEYDVSRADGIVSVHVTTLTVKKNNELHRWVDKKKQVHFRYTSEVYVAGYCTLTATRTGATQTIQFGKSETHTTYDNPHQFSVEALGLNGVRSAARDSSVMKPIYTQFPLTGYVVGTGDSSRVVLINRGSEHGVKVGRKWDFVLEQSESNVLLGDVTTVRVVGGGKTVEVNPQTCVVKCDSGKTRERVKLGMKAKAQGFGFLWLW